MNTVIALLLALFSAATAVPQAQAASEPVALVADVRGDVRMMSPAPGGAVARLAWLHAGARIETTKDASATIVFWSGRRWRIEPASSAQITKDGVSRLTGRVSALESLPALPHLPPIASESVRASGYGAVRLRGGHWALLYPRAGARTIAGATTLTFEPKQPGGPYRVEVIDQDGSVVFETETQETRVTVPPDRLRQGARYTWMVRPPMTPGVGAGASEFVTLDRAAEGMRRALHAAATSKDAASLAMLAEIDLSLGLLEEARRGFEDALALAAGDAVLRARLDELRAAMIPTASRR